ncbi:hypothetical protein FH972_021267 [Carpinus fangiana]|uniref:Zn(2)-C6 fungal-type domain-containing protein n=1 Tax=Carpinus fangiana TaxID=176857 RepID=A0A5N6KP79_9ROSI|nr:hypothetical protein FH972_021267 [Carpinus fangiana]
MADSKITKKSAASNTPHTRSRSGCHTCRLRRKKCDESKPICRACKHLGIECDYKRPSWWSHPERRKQQKDLIKDLIKRTQQQKPTPKPGHSHGLIATSPPSLSNSAPTEPSSDFPRTRAASLDSTFSPHFSLHTPQDFFTSPNLAQPQWTPMSHHFGQMSPYDVDIKTERQMFVNDIPTRKDSTMSSFSAYPTPLIGSTPIGENWIHEEHQEHFETHFEQTFTTEQSPLGLNIFDFAHPPLSPQHKTVIEVEECDKYLLEHFLENVADLIFPVFDKSQFGSVRSDIILPSLETNKCYQHCCLSIAAMHLKATGQAQDAKRVDEDIMRHRFETVSQLCQAFNSEGPERAGMLEATLSLIFFQASVASPDDGLLDIPWYQHFQGAVSLIDELGLVHAPFGAPGTAPLLRSFNMTLASWIDIVGATMTGRVPTFADLYRERVEANISSGLAELMGCDDRVMYLISEIACLDALKSQGMDEVMLCKHIEALGHNLTLTEQPLNETSDIYSPSGATRPKELSQTITAVYRVAARIYLCSLVPGFDKSQEAIVVLVDLVTDLISSMPAGAESFDRSLVWPLLVTGSVSVEYSSFRKLFAERVEQLGILGTFGSVGRIRELLADLWAVNDDMAAKGELQSVHWRDVMHQKGWDFLLI